MSEVWNPRRELTAQEQRILHLCRKQKLWAFLREHRQVILDEEIREALAAMYKGGGRPPVCPERMALAMLLQVAFGVADHEVPTLTAVDLRWQMVLDCLGQTEPLFSQGSVFHFRERARAAGLMRQLLDKTVQIARQTRGFSHKRLRALFDASPLWGAGRVEDTINLVGRALGELVEEAALVSGQAPAELAKALQLTVVGASSVKAALDLDWRQPDAPDRALNQLLDQFQRVSDWLDQHVEQTHRQDGPLAEAMATVHRLVEQDTEPIDGSIDSKRVPRVIREGVAKDRLICLSDRDMRHGRKSKTRRYAGYQRHLGGDADVPGLACAVHVQAANDPESDATEPLVHQVERVFELVSAQFDTGYLASDIVVQLKERGVEIVTKPPAQPSRAYSPKSAFTPDFQKKTLTCPGGVTRPMVLGKPTAFPTEVCHACPPRQHCIAPTNKGGRTVQIHLQEQWHREMSEELGTAAGRAKRRERTPIEHLLARIGAIQGPKARYRGLEKNQFHLEAVAVVNNCFVLREAFDERMAA